MHNPKIKKLLTFKKSVKKPVCLSSLQELKNKYILHKDKIDKFYSSKIRMTIDELVSVSIKPSTYRSFHRKDKKQIGMSIYFRQTAKKYHNKDLLKNKDAFITDLFYLARKNIKFKSLDEEWPRIAKLYNLYANYYVAFGKCMKPNFNVQIRKLEIPLDKYSLNYIGCRYNSLTENFRIPSSPSMGSIKSKNHYNKIRNFISMFSKNVAGDFVPIYIDLIQSFMNKLNWYELNRIKKDLNHIRSRSIN